ncbi:hypothetical protein LTR62_007079 [Meristemomyces frigidus]|uniref:DNA repair exonuclease rad1 n=1 Tax=Meristemomyces frigidus TaxID=1508187 RepID=A0AAN7TBM7_9PEZI|nr:hypothetical protein LTR62_007079 [Meristemomyces frigidus]
MAAIVPMFSAVASSTRHILLLLRCISFAKKALVRISAEGLRFSTDEGSSIEAFVFLDKALFTSYTYHAPEPASSQDDPPEPPFFEIDLQSLLETLNIFSLSDLTSSTRSGGYDDFAAHRLNRHAGMNAFTNHAMGVTGVCNFSYNGEGGALSIHMFESGVTTTCDLTTYEADTVEDIPFNRDSLSVKTIMRAKFLLEAVTELNSVNPASMTVFASPGSASKPNLSLSAIGALGTAAIDFTTATSSETPVLESLYCPTETSASYPFAALKAAQRAMASATKVSLRLDDEGVLSLQFLIELEVGSSDGSGAVAFVDFRIVPLVDDEGAREHGGESTSE